MRTEGKKYGGYSVSDGRFFVGMGMVIFAMIWMWWKIRKLEVVEKEQDKRIQRIRSRMDKRFKE